jgi:uncharacterized protein YjbI with pentapeptide repeats
MDADELLLKYKSGTRDFTGILLCEANLSRANLSHANLSQAILSITNLSGANLSEVNFSQAKLNVARLSGANLTRARLDDAILNVANLIRADLREASLINASLIRAELMRSDLSHGLLMGANLSEADLREATLRQANLEQVNLNGANLTDAILIGSNLERASLHRACLTKADLRGVNLSNGELRQVNLSKANLSGADLRGANLRWADLNGANLSGANLEQARLSGASLCGANLSGANLMNAVLIHADLTQANLINSDCTGADLTGSSLTGAKLYGVSRFDLKAEEITCDWIDLSPLGDSNQIQTFSPKEANKFFNATFPTVEISVDTRLGFEAHTILAKIYHYLQQQSSLLTQPPTLEVNSRRTVISFKIESNEQLFNVAYVAILPFRDADVTQKAIESAIKQLTPDNCGHFPVQLSNRIVQLGVEISQQIRLLSDIKLPQSLPAEIETSTPFFFSPTRTLLRSSSHQNLILHSHAYFGRSLGCASESSESSESLNNPYLNPKPLDTESILNFIRGF